MVRTSLAAALSFPLCFGIEIVVFDSIYSPPDTGAPKLLIPGARRHAEIQRPLTQGWTYDDADDLSREDELETVDLLVETGPDARGGHVALRLPGMTVGFRTKHRLVEPWDYINPFASPAEGTILDDTGRGFDRILRYRASPRTVARLQRSIRIHAGDGYQLGNWSGGRNCATWAQDRLFDVGLLPPPGDCPNRMAWYMDPYSPSDDAEIAETRFAADEQTDRSNDRVAVSVGLESGKSGI